MGIREAIVLQAQYLPTEARVRLVADSATPEWMSIWSLCHELSEDVRDESLLELSIPPWILFGLASALRLHARAGRVRFDPDVATAGILRNVLNSRLEIDGRSRPETAPDRVADDLRSAGFRRNLTPAQTRNVATLIQYSAAADFSVPGSGKTTEALAYFALKRTPGDKLIVVAPVNAFAPWEEQIDLCFGRGVLRVARLVQSAESITQRLESAPDVALINYHKVSQPAAHQALATYLSQQSSFVFLDESHKIKRGEDGAVGDRCARPLSPS